MKRVLVTGANGFVGSNLCNFLQKQNIAFRRAVRAPGVSQNEADTFIAGDLTLHTDWSQALSDVDAVVHLAARVHVMDEREGDPLVQYRAVNVEGSLNLARQAAKAGVRRFIFLSTIKVNGEETFAIPFSPEDLPSPKDSYSISKFEAEMVLQQVADETGMELVIIRPPMVYGKGAGGNYARLLRLVNKGWFLPFGMIRNKRSMVGIENLCSLITCCLESPAAAGRTLLVSDGTDVSMPELVRLIAGYCENRAMLLPVPVWLLRLAGFMFGRAREIERVTGNLQVDSSETCRLLGWHPPLTLEEGVKQSI